MPRGLLLTSRLCLVTVFVLLGAASAAPATAQVCVGDCNSDGTVAVNELVVGIDIALGAANLHGCSSLDADRSEMVTVDELVTAVNNALSGCPANASGVLLQGSPDMLALDAVHDLDHEHGSPASAFDTEGSRRLIRSRIEFGFTTDATVGQVNTLLDSIGGRIVMMLGNVPILLVQIPDPGSVDALNTVVAGVGAKPIVRFVNKAYLPQPAILPNNFLPKMPEPDFSKIDHHFAVRAPAAWNARNAIQDARQATVVIYDYLGGGPPVNAPPGGFDVRLDRPGDFVMNQQPCPPDSFCVNPPSAPICQCEHGYHVLGVIAAGFGGVNSCTEPFDDATVRDCATGIFPGRTPVRAVDLSAGIDRSAGDDKAILILKQLAGQGVNAILNSSLAGTCLPEDCDVAEAARQDALVWIEKVRRSGLEGRFLHVTAACNVDEKFPSINQASTCSGYTAAALVPHLQGGGIAVPSLTNVLVIENGISTSMPTDEMGCLNNISFIGGDLSAIGTEDFGNGVWSLENATGGGDYGGGTSNATPQVSGLASYVWALAPELTPQQVAGLLRATARRDLTYPLRGVDDRCYGPEVQPAPTIDAYDAVLSLDAALPGALLTPPNAPIRFALLNVNVNGDSKDKFDEADLDEFLSVYAPSGVPVRPIDPNWSRYDLNGDGFTGSTRTAKFDLDREGSTQFGATFYSTVTQMIDDLRVSFDETQLTDMQILCYYAYSGLYTGDTDKRKKMLAGLCTTVTVTVDPAVVTLTVGGSQQFSAMVEGTDDPRVRWMVVSGDGTVSDTGLFTAGQTPGTATVRATSVADPKAFGEATVTVGGGSLASLGIRTGRSPGMIEAFLTQSLGQGPLIISAAITDVSGFLGQLSAHLSGISQIGLVTVQLDESVALNLNLGSIELGELDISGNACQSNLTVKAGNVLQGLVPGAGGFADITGCVSSVTLQLGNVQRGVFVGNALGALTHDVTAHVAVHSTLTLDIENTSGTTVDFAGTIESTGSTFAGLQIWKGNTNLLLASPISSGALNDLHIENTSFQSPPVISVGDVAIDPSFVVVTIIGNSGLSLGDIQMGNVVGGVTITNNHGFSDAAAQAFVQARTVQGTVTITGNVP